MGLTITEKILMSHCLQGQVKRGAIIEASLDRIMVHESISISIAKTVEQMGVERLSDPAKVVSFLDHWAPAPTEDAAVMHQTCRDFVRRFKIAHPHDVNGGVCHQVMIERFVLPGQVVVGSDSHCPTYGALNCLGIGLGFTDAALAMVEGHVWLKVPEVMRVEVKGRMADGVTGKDVILHMLGDLGTEGADYLSLEFSGPGLANLTMDDRFTICNMTAEMGAKAAIMPTDHIMRAYLADLGCSGYTEVQADEDAAYDSEYEIDLDALVPLAALPRSPGNVHPIAEAAGTIIDQVYIGGCTNGRLADLRQAARILKGHKVAPGVRFLIYPASYKVLLDGMADGTIQRLVEAGAMLGPPACGPCFGAHLGLLGPSEKCFSAGNRNFVGRMGSKKAEIYLGSPYSAAAAALAGEIVDPREFLKSSRRIP
jgi:3-isopropylmalate/(R)-2-methylmalate dehydratase large subunit